MSLINEALKRTRDAARQVTASRTSDVDSYRLTSQPQTSSSRSRTVVWIAAIVGIIVVAVAGFVAYRLLNNTPAESDAPEVKRLVPRPPAPVVPPETPAAPGAVAITDAVSSNAEQTASLGVEKLKEADSDQTQPPDPDPEPPSPPPPVVPDPPKLVLEGITTDSLDRTALINGVVLRVGEEFMGVTVISIENRVVRLKFGAKEIVLRMP